MQAAADKVSAHKFMCAVTCHSRPRKASAMRAAFIVDSTL
jgi:hypothetical protein